MKRPGLLSHLPTRDIGTLLKSVRRYTRVVGLIKFLLIIVGVGLAVVVAAIPFLKTEESNIRIMFSSLEKSDSDTPAMVNPRFQGVDRNNQPFSITADVAEQKDANTVIMRQIKADITLKDQQWLALLANQGSLDMNLKRLLLSGNVNVFYGNGYELRTDRVLVDLNTSAAVSDTAVEGQGPMGALQASGFTVQEKGNIINFTGPVRVTIYRENQA